MVICLHRIKAILCNQSFFNDFISLYSEKIDARKTYPLLDSSVHDKRDGVNFNSVHHCNCKLQPFY